MWGRCRGCVSRVQRREDVGELAGEFPPSSLGLACLRKAGSDVQTGRTRMLGPSAQIEAELLELDSEAAINCVGAVASDVDDHISSPVLEDATDGRREPRFARSTQWSRVSGCTACTVVTKIESAVLDPLLSHLSTFTANAGTESNRRRTERSP
jgi:hypothetical protein